MSTNSVEAGVSQPAGQDHSRLLRRALQLDAVASGALGVLLVAAGPAVDDLLGIPVGVLMAVGLVLVAYATRLWIVGARRHLPTPASWAVVAGNLLWVAGSVLVVVAGWWPPTTAGTAFVVAQAAAVALFAVLQFLGLRASRAAS